MLLLQLRAVMAFAQCLRPLSMERSISCHICYDMFHQYTRSHPTERLASRLLRQAVDTEVQFILGPPRWHGGV